MSENDTLQIHTARAARLENSVLHTRALVTVASCAGTTITLLIVRSLRRTRIGTRAR